MINSNEKVIKHKVGLLNLAEQLGNVSKACQIMGLSRDTFYRYKAAVEEGGVEGLFERQGSRRLLHNTWLPILSPCQTHELTKKWDGSFMSMRPDNTIMP